MSMSQMEVDIETVYDPPTQALLLMQRLGFSTEERQPYSDLFELPNQANSKTALMT